MHRKVNDYNAFILNKYNDVFEIVGGNANDNTFYTTWVIATEYDKDSNTSIPAMKEDGKYRYLPVKVVLGTREEAIENLRWLLSQLTGETPVVSDDKDNDNVPF